MSMPSIVISGYKSGAVNNKKPFLLTDDAFVTLYNAYVYREEVRKREGLQLIGRYRRVLTGQAQANADGTASYNIADILIGVRATEPNAEIEAGSVIITVDDGGGNETEFTDQGNGTFLRTAGVAYNIDPGTFINYVTGELNIVWNAGGTPAAGISITLDFNYFPALPGMGIHVKEIAGINDEDTIWFDTKYAYLHDGANFQEFLPASAATWNGTDSDFFWATNYRGSEAQDRLFFVTNFVADSGSPMRYTGGSNWEEFKPSINGGLENTQVLTKSLASGSAAFGPSIITDLPILEGTVVITVTHNQGRKDDVVFKDTPEDGTLVSSGLNTGTIDYVTGAVQLFFNPVLPGSGTWTVTVVYQLAGSFLFSARILIPYYGRLVALNTWEGTTAADSVNIFNRARFSQVGSPIQGDSWRSDVFGKGGFIDAPVNEDIISATFYKNTLIVHFERSTWRLQYIGEYGTPFIWERISSDFGSESTFSSVLFDSGVLTVGDKAIIGSSGNDAQRIDLDIPDIVYDFKNAENGPKRVHGIRDFRKEIAYWCYPEYSTLETDQYFPNKTVLYNYRNGTFAFFRNNVTCFGNFQYTANITWDRLDVFWDSPNVFWDGAIQEGYPVIVCANQQGFASFYGYPDAETQSDSTIVANDQETLAITDIVVTDIVTLEIPNHNFVTDDVIYITGMIFLQTASSTPGSTTLNDKIYFVNFVDADNISLLEFNPQTNSLANTVATNVGTYIGGGVVALFPKMEIETKDFNPIRDAGQNIKTSYVDFLFDVSKSAAISVIMKMNTNVNNQGNLTIGNNSVETCNRKTGFITDVILGNAGVDVIIESVNHGLLNGNEISFSDIKGSTELNGNSYIVTFISVDRYSINQDSALVSPYESGGLWIQTLEEFWNLNADYTWHRFFSTCFGQYVALILTYSEEQMAQLSTHQQNFALNAMQIYYRPGGRNIFGR